MSSESAGVAGGAAKSTRGPEGDLDIVVAAAPREVRFLLGHLAPHPVRFLKLCEGGGSHTETHPFVIFVLKERKYGKVPRYRVRTLFLSNAENLVPLPFEVTWKPHRLLFLPE